MASEILPPEWFTPERLSVVLEFLRFLPIEAAQKKLLLMQWAQEVGIEVTGDMIRELEAEAY